MIAAPIRLSANEGEGSWQGEKCPKKRWQDTSRTPFRRKTVGFLMANMGAPVDERAARKEKASKNNAPNGTIAGLGRKATRP
jgi:hypothetical protein